MISHYSVGEKKYTQLVYYVWESLQIFPTAVGILKYIGQII